MFLTFAPNISKVLLWQLHMALDVTCCTCSILHLCAVSIDRYHLAQGWTQIIDNSIQFPYKRSYTSYESIMILALGNVEVLTSKSAWIE